MGAQPVLSKLDGKALAQIYDEFHPAIYRYIYRQVSDVECARDLSADVFHRLLQTAAKKNAPDQDVKAWLYRTAHNIVIDHYRRSSHRDHLPLNEQTLAGSANPALSAEIHIDAALVRQAMRNLTEDQHQVVSLKFLAGMSNDEVAEIMQKPVGAVKSLQHRALAALQRHLIPEKEIAR